MASPPVLENPRNSTLGKRRAGATATPTDAAGAREPRAKKKPSNKDAPETSVPDLDREEIEEVVDAVAAGDVAAASPAPAQLAPALQLASSLAAAPFEESAARRRAVPTVVLAAAPPPVVVTPGAVAGLPLSFIALPPPARPPARVGGASAQTDDDPRAPNAGRAKRSRRKPAKKSAKKPGGAPRASKPREGSVGGATPQRKRRKKAEAGGASGGAAAATARGAAPDVDVDTLLLDDAKIAVRQANPKKAGSKSALRYDAYKPATTASEFLRLGGSKADLAHDCAKGFVSVVVEAERAAPVPPRSDPVVDRYDAGRLRDEAVRRARAAAPVARRAAAPAPPRVAPPPALVAAPAPPPVAPPPPAAPPRVAPPPPKKPRPAAAAPASPYAHVEVGARLRKKDDTKECTLLSKSTNGWWKIQWDGDVRKVSARPSTLVLADDDTAPAAPPAIPARDGAAVACDGDELDDDATIPLAAPPAPSPPRPAPRPAPPANHGRPRDEPPAPAEPAAGTRDSPCARRLGRFTVDLSVNTRSVALRLRVPFAWDATVGALQEEILTRAGKRGFAAERCALSVNRAALDDTDTLEQAVEPREQALIEAELSTPGASAGSAF